jgi:hypothetical protein
VTDAEAWVHFYAALVAGSNGGRFDAAWRAGQADLMLAEYKQRFPSPVRVDAECMHHCIQRESSYLTAD